VSTKPVLPFVEMMVTQACNLSCHGCTNYSDLAHSGYLTWEEGKDQILPWLERVDIPDFGILGGEPLMNPGIIDWLTGLRKLMPDTQIRFTTNGLLLHKNLEILDIMQDLGNIVFKIAVHENNTDLENIIQKVFDRFAWEPVAEFGIDRFKTKNNLRFYVRRPDIFYKTYLGTYDNMRPHNSDPVQAIEICCQRYCPLLYKNKIYKCSTGGLLEETLSRFGFPNREEWAPYIPKGLSLDCSDNELSDFLDNFGKPDTICGQCPTAKDTGSAIIHLENVSRKKIK